MSEPFVVASFKDEVYRVECEWKNRKHTALPHESVYALMRELGLKWGPTMRKEEVQGTVNTLNLLVKQGAIILQGPCWVVKEDK